MKKAIIAYYSYEGSTRKVAESIAEHTRADLLEIKPVDEMQKRGFGKYIWGGYGVVMGKMPKLEPFGKDLDGYGTVIIGSPVWAFSYAPPIKTLLWGGYIKNKRVAFFCCCESNPGKTVERAKEEIEKDNDFIGGKVFNAKQDMEMSLAESVSWANEILKQND